MNYDTFQYALENTRIIRAPQARLSTFGSSLVNYYVLTENMDQIGKTRVHEGQVEAERPQIISPLYIARLMVDGFGEQAQAFAEAVSANAGRLAFLKYGFRFKKNEIRSYEVHESIEQLADRVTSEVEARHDPFAAVLLGVDEAWEVSLLKFMVDFIGESAPDHVNELRRRGLFGGDVA